MPDLRPSPRWLLAGLAALAALCLFLAIRHFSAPDLKASYDEPTVASQAVFLAIRPGDGAITARAEADGPEAFIVAPEHCGFLRGILQSQVRPRARAGVSASAPFRFILTDSGRLLLTDPGTPMKLDAAAFGPTNEAQLRDIFEAVRAGRRGSYAGDANEDAFRER